MTALIEKLITKTDNYRDIVPVFRIEPRSLDEQEALAVRFAASVAGRAENVKSRIARGSGRSDVLLSEGVRARVYHASGSISVKASLGPMDHLIGEKANKEALTQSATAAAKRLGLDLLVGPGEHIQFERLWQIKAAGMNRERVRGRDIVCRAVGAFRRYLRELPVWGRASAVIEIAGDELIGGIGIDWRRILAEPLDQTKVIDPERAARAVMGDLNGRLPGGELGDDDFEVAMFSLGYMSLPKRRVQGIFAPVYVAMLERRGWTTMNYVIVVNASETMYGDIGRPSSFPPRDAAKPEPGAAKGKSSRAFGWSPLGK
jgi:hypothetical protein